VSAAGFERLAGAAAPGDLGKLIALRALVDRANGDGGVSRAAWLTAVGEEYGRWYPRGPEGTRPEHFASDETVRYLDEHVVRALTTDGVLQPVVVTADAEAGAGADGAGWDTVRLSTWAAEEVHGARDRVLELLDTRIGAILEHTHDAAPAAVDLPPAPAGPSVDGASAGIASGGIASGGIAAGGVAAGGITPGMSSAEGIADGAGAQGTGAIGAGTDAPLGSGMEPFIRPGEALVPGGATLAAKGLVKIYRKRRVVNEVDVHVSQGEIVGLLGPNGAGKTTSFYMMVGLIRPDRGKVFIGSKDLTGVPMYRRARAGIGYLAQEPSIFRKLTVEENVMAILQMMKIPRSQRKQRLETLLDELSIKHLRKTRAYALSGGERRRLEITRALVGNPKFMLLDEPFAGVDPIAVHDIQQIVSDLRRRGIGVLISDHNVEQTLDIVDRAYIMYDGRVRVSGTVSELVWNEEAAEIYLGPTLTARMRERYPNPHAGREADAAALDADADGDGAEMDPRDAAEADWAAGGAWGVDDDVRARYEGGGPVTEAAGEDDERDGAEHGPGTHG
jgi:LPS export ABC transporter ATP-binding protein